MKKGIKILIAVVACILGILLIVPLMLKGKIKDIAETTANEMLEAKVSLGDVSMNFFSDFPNASLGVKDVAIVGINDFSGDTLANVGELDVVINLASLFGDSYEINEVELNDATLNAKLLANGLANWDIVISSDSTEVESDTTASSPFKLDLDDFSVNNLSVSYDDQMDSMFAAVKGLDLQLVGDISLDLQTLANIEKFKMAVGQLIYKDEKGSLGADLRNVSMDFSGSMSDKISNISTTLSVDSLSLLMENIPYLSNVKTEAEIELEADLENNKFKFGKNYLKLNEIKANFEGFVHVLESSMDMDLKINTPDIDFKQILSLIPIIYKDDFASLQTSGSVNLNAFAKGRMAGDTLPELNIDLNIADAMFKYPDLPSSVKDINIVANVRNNGNITDSTQISVPQLAFNMAGNPFKVSLGVKTPISDPDFNFAANGKLDLGKIVEVVHLEDISLKGIFDAALVAKGKMSYIDKEEYEKFHINGDLNLADFVLDMSSLNYDVLINEAKLGFSSQFINLNAGLALGESDIALKGKLQNFIQYIMRGETIKGSLDVNSKLLNVSELLGEEESETKEVAEDTTAGSSSIHIPGNLDFALNANIATLLYDGIELKDIIAALSIKDQKAKINSIKANTMGGSLGLSGTFDTQDTLKPVVDFDIDVKDMIIAKVFTDITTANKLVPLLADANGNFSMNMDFHSDMDSELNPILNSINASGNFISKEVGLDSVAALEKIAELVKYPALKNPSLKDISIKFLIKDGRVTADPFETFIQTAKLNVSGSSGLDQTLDYVTTITLPESIKSLVPLAIDVKIGGTFRNPKISIGAEKTLENLKETAIETVTKVVDEAKEKAIAAAKESKEKLVQAAIKQKESLVKVATESGNKLVAKAQQQSDSLQAKANNPIAKAAAKKTGDALVKKAQEQSKKLVNDATASGDKLINNAQKEGDELINKVASTTKSENTKE
ncbi:MAG: AsmA family protein [Paludibacteraceae bacterium]|nr:AsmA family protein [Paludibacteraceae bacterium]